MKLGLGLYRHMLNDEYYAFAVQAGCTHVIVHLVDYFRQGQTNPSNNPSNNQPTGGKDQPWGLAGDPNRLWSAAELIQLRKNVEAAGLKLEGIEEAYRIRVGDYRVLYRIQDRVLTVTVVRVGHRRDVYRKEVSGGD